MADTVLDEVMALRELVKGSDSIELKLTLPEHSYRSAAAALGVDPLEAQIRQVFFFDTPDLDLNKAGVVARARRIQGKRARFGGQAASRWCPPTCRPTCATRPSSPSRSTRCPAPAGCARRR